MNKTVNKIANKFRRTLRGDITFKVVEDYMSELGIPVIFFNTPVGDAEIAQYCLQDKAMKYPAFTYFSSARIIFIDNEASSEDKLYLLLHEVGHILLNHIGRKKDRVRNKYVMEIEADTFAYTVLNPPKSKVPMYVGLSALCISLAVPCINAYNARKIFAVDTVPAQNTQILPTSSPATTSNKVVVDEVVNEAIGEVLVTPTGKKYHLPDCRYVKNKHCATLTIAKAQKKYAPCLVCEPDKDSYWQN